MVRQKQTISPAHEEVLCNWKERGFVDLQFEFEELTEHYIRQLTKVAKNCLITFTLRAIKGRK